jgi:hypothetical protein
VLQLTIFELNVPEFNSGEPEEFLCLLNNIKKVLARQNITNRAGKYALAHCLLQGDALSAFVTAPARIGGETMVNFQTVLNELTTHVFPQRALQQQKRYMRRWMRKPKTMQIRDFVTRVVELNDYLPKFPPFGADQKLQDDELMDILEYAVPLTWQRTMFLHNFDPVSHTPTEFVSFCERLEYAEPQEMKSQTDLKGSHKGQISGARSSVRGHSSTQNRTNNKRKFSDHNKDKWCEYHQVSGHDTGECKVILAQAKRMRQTWEASSEKQGNYKNKTWKKNDNNNDKKKDSFALKKIIENSIKEALQNQTKNDPPKSEDLDTFNIDDFAALSTEDIDE